MKNILLITALALCTAAAQSMPVDTVIVVNGKRIEVAEAGNRLKVKVYEQTENEGVVEDELVFEGHYKDGRSHESRKYIRSVNIPIPSWNHRRGFDSHWAGFGMGFANFADENLKHINDIDGVSLHSGSSLEYNLNFWEDEFLFSPKSGWALVTGLGMRWSRYRIAGNHYFAETGGVTSFHPAPDGVTYSASKLNITSLTIPLLLEWQNRRKRSIPLFISAGVVGVIKTASSSRVTYQGNKNRKMDSGMNLRPITYDILLQAGLKGIGVYAKYSPMELFESGKGPKIHPVSIGLQIHL
ncbi:MAG: outer membrane beta-barrel protein [Tannerellaceae bacterium]|jgi:hypothetical protein|nr:outer membrane beta-barrel protein [Tannerellaceae bacterium]